MSILVVGLSHKSAPVATLERAVLTADATVKLLRDVRHADDITGSMVVSTCNRVEVYAEVGKFHSAVAAVCELLARHSGVPLAELTPHLYVHYEDRAVQHLLAVSCGLDSMVLGESQILGQVRQALSLAREQGTVDRVLSEAGALALRTGKRAHAETGIDRAGASLLSVGLTAAARRLRPAGRAGGDGDGQALAGRSVLVVGAGSMSSLAVAGAARAGADRIVVANRTRIRAKRLAATVSGQPAELADLPALMAAADLVISCTGAPGSVITAGMVREALAGRGRPGAGLVLLDLALPRDVEAAAGQLPGVTVVDLETLAAGQHGEAVNEAGDVAAVRAILAQEFAAYVSAGRAAAVAPTVVALRAKAAQVVDAELARLAGRLDGLDQKAWQEIGRSMARITDKLLHAPTVRVKELAGAPGADSYEAALRVLFDLDPDAVRAVVRADAGLAGMDAAEALDAVGPAAASGSAGMKEGAS